MVRRTALGLIAAAVMLVAGCSSGGIQARKSFALQEPWQDYERVVVRSRNGAIDVSVAAGADVRVDGRMRASGFTIQEAQDNVAQLDVTVGPDAGQPRTLLIELHMPAGLDQKSPGADITVHLPQACAAELETSNGSVRAAGLTGAVVLRSSNGSVTAEDVSGNVLADTSNARVVLRKISGEISAETNNGGIDVQTVSGKCRLVTSNGRIEVSDAHGDVDASTSNGSVQVDAAPSDTGSVVLRSSNGSIRATLPSTMTAEVDLDTSNGGVHAAFGEIPVKVREMGKRRVAVGLNGGGAGRITASTSNGSITLEFR